MSAVSTLIGLCGGLAFGLSVASWMPQEPSPVTEKLVVQELEIRSADPNSSVIMLMASEEGASFIMQDSDGENELAINLHREVIDGKAVSTASISLDDARGDLTMNAGSIVGSNAAKGSSNSWILADMDGTPAILVCDSEGKPKISISTLKNGDGNIVLGGKDGKELSLVPPAK